MRYLGDRLLGVSRDDVMDAYVGVEADLQVRTPHALAMCVIV